MVAQLEQERTEEHLSPIETSLRSRGIFVDSSEQLRYTVFGISVDNTHVPLVLSEAVLDESDPSGEKYLKITAGFVVQTKIKEGNTKYNAVTLILFEDHPEIEVKNPQDPKNIPCVRIVTYYQDISGAKHAIQMHSKHNKERVLTLDEFALMCEVGVEKDIHPRITLDSIARSTDMRIFNTLINDIEATNSNFIKRGTYNFTTRTRAFYSDLSGILADALCEPQRPDVVTRLARLQKALPTVDTEEIAAPHILPSQAPVKHHVSLPPTPSAQIVNTKSGIPTPFSDRFGHWKHDNDPVTSLNREDHSDDFLLNPMPSEGTIEEDETEDLDEFGDTFDTEDFSDSTDVTFADLPKDMQEATRTSIFELESFFRLNILPPLELDDLESLDQEIAVFKPNNPWYINSVNRPSKINSIKLSENNLSEDQNESDTMLTMEINTNESTVQLRLTQNGEIYVIGPNKEMALLQDNQLLEFLSIALGGLYALINVHEINVDDEEYSVDETYMRIRDLIEFVLPNIYAYNNYDRLGRKAS